MKKRLAERIRIEKKTDGKRHKNFSIIVGIFDEIKEALDLGWSRFAIWQQLKKEGIYKSGFQSFLYNLSKLTSAENQQTKATSENKSDIGKIDKDEGPTIARCSDDGKTFSWNNVKKK